MAASRAHRPKYDIFIYKYNITSFTRNCAAAQRHNDVRAAIARLGCTLDGILRVDRPAADGSVRDSAIFSITADEWPAARSRLVARLTA